MGFIYNLKELLLCSTWISHLVVILTREKKSLHEIIPWFDITSWLFKRLLVKPGLYCIVYYILVYTKTVDSVKRARWLARQTPNMLCYLPPSNSGKMASRIAPVTSEEINQINFLCCILCHCFSIYYNNYSPQCRWLALSRECYLIQHWYASSHVAYGL